MINNVLSQILICSIIILCIWRVYDCTSRKNSVEPKLRKIMSLALDNVDIAKTKSEPLEILIYTNMATGQLMALKEIGKTIDIESIIPNYNNSVAIIEEASAAAVKNITKAAAN